MPKEVGIVAKTESKEALEIAKRIYNDAKTRGLIPVLEKKLSFVFHRGNGKLLSEMDVDLMITLGGDGTVLKTIREMPSSDTPILAINLGRRGYLTEVEPEQCVEALSRWLHGDCEIEEQWRLSVSLNGSQIGDCLNEALILPKTPDKMVNISAAQNGKRIIKARADGFMVATPTGSTAHSFSAGGPVLETSLDVLVITLIAPLQPVRSLVVPASRTLSVKLEDPGPRGVLVNDGTPVKEIRVGQILNLKRSPNSAHFVRFGDTFLQRGLRRLSSERENG